MLQSLTPKGISYVALTIVLLDILRGSRKLFSPPEMHLSGKDRSVSPGRALKTLRSISNFPN